MEFDATDAAISSGLARLTFPDTKNLSLNSEFFFVFQICTGFSLLAQN